MVFRLKMPRIGCRQKRLNTPLARIRTDLQKDQANRLFQGKLGTVMVVCQVPLNPRPGWSIRSVRGALSIELVRQSGWQPRLSMCGPNALRRRLGPEGTGSSRGRTSRFANRGSTPSSRPARLPSGTANAGSVVMPKIRWRNVMVVKRAGCQILAPGKRTFNADGRHLRQPKRTAA